MHEIRSSNPPVVTGICDPNKSQARHHRSFKIGLKLKYLNKNIQNKQVDYNSDRSSYLTSETFLSINHFGREARNFFDTPQQVWLQYF